MPRWTAADIEKRVQTWSEPKGRAYVVTMSLLFAVAGFWAGRMAISDAAPADRPELSRMLVILFVIAGLIMMVFTTLHLGNPRVRGSGKTPAIGVFVIALAVYPVVVLMDQIPVLAVLFMGLIGGACAGVFVVAAFDFATNKLSRGRSWRGRPLDRESPP